MAGGGSRSSSARGRWSANQIKEGRKKEKMEIPLQCFLPLLSQQHEFHQVASACTRVPACQNEVTRRPSSVFVCAFFPRLGCQWHHWPIFAPSLFLSLSPLFFLRRFTAAFGTALLFTFLSSEQVYECVCVCALSPSLSQLYVAAQPSCRRSSRKDGHFLRSASIKRPGAKLY